MAVTDKKQLGDWGEEKALEYLAENGYTAVSKGFHSRFGEIDLIVKNDKYLVFAEVKTRKKLGIAYPREYVSRVKQKKIISTAKYWMMKNPMKLQPRFDVIEVYANNGKDTTQPEIVHLENAFQ